ncbi:hypothetical protein [Flavobacterium fluviatile]|uniref:hypothetical protein n=1 Tax=Flavobacterium fluviatile TaxID=1862387 RepID=UPI0013D78FCC|nr:hypothetical protein [Flavobacterium fluviatile]
MEELQKVFSNREIAYIIWTTLIFVFILSKQIGNAFGKVIKRFFASKLSVLYISMLLFTIMEVYLIYKMGFWNSSFIKDTSFWFVTFSFLTLFKSINARKIRDFIPIINNIFKLTIFLEFIINFRSFNLTVEIIMLPLITFLGIAKFISEKNDDKYSTTFILNILSIIGLFYFLFSVFKTINEFSKFTSKENLNTLVLPAFLSFFSLPFFYLVALYNEYEQIFMRVKYMTKNKKNQNKIKMQIFKKAKFNLNRISLLRDKLIDFDLFETNDIKIYLDKIKNT